MKTLVAITFLFSIIANAEPKFKYDESKDPNRDQKNKEAAPPQRPSYYDAYKKYNLNEQKSSAKEQKRVPAAPNADSQVPPQVSPEAQQAIQEQLKNIDPAALQKAQEQLQNYQQQQQPGYQGQ